MGGISSCFAMNRQGKWDESPFHCRCHSSGRMSGNAETGKLGDRRKYDFVLYFNLHVYRRSWHRKERIAHTIQPTGYPIPTVYSLNAIFVTKKEQMGRKGKRRLKNQYKRRKRPLCQDPDENHKGLT